MQSWLIRPKLKKNSSAPTAIIRPVKAWRKKWEEVLFIWTMQLWLRLVRPGNSFRIVSWLILVILHESWPLFPVSSWQEWRLPGGVFCCWSPSSWRLYRLVYHLKPICPFSSNLWAFSVSPRDGLEDPRRSAVSEIIRPPTTTSW